LSQTFRRYFAAEILAADCRTPVSLRELNIFSAAIFAYFLRRHYSFHLMNSHVT
jgi:hypothetical protein